MNTPAAVRALSIPLFLALAALPGRAASFSAELVDTRAGQTRTGPFNYQDKSYRFEVAENGQTLIIMVDGQSGTMRLLNPTEKAYYEAGPEEPMSLFANPFAAYAYYAKTKAVRTEGVESAGGVPCKKQVVSGGGQVFVTAWVSDEFDVPLKVQTQLDGRTVELRNIKRAPQDVGLFAVPAGYKLVTIEPEPPLEWAKQVADAPVLTPPFEKTLAEGAIIRIRPQAGRRISLQGTNAGDGSCTFTAVAFKGGKPVDDPSGNMVTLEGRDSVKEVHGEGPAEADDIVVHVARGAVTIKTEFVAAPGSAPAATPAAVAPAPSTPAATQDLSAEVSAPDSAEVAMCIDVSWKGPANSDDYISVARPDQPPGAFVNRALVREGNPLKVWTPSDPGQFEMRYILGRGAKLLAKSPIAVTAVTAKVEPAGPVNVAAWIEVKWEGPARDGDYITVSRPDQKSGAFLGVTLAKEGNPLKVRAPSDAGDYEVRYILARGAKLLAKAPITVNPVTAEVRAPASAAAGAEFEVQWQGPGYSEDFVSVARANQAPGEYVYFAWVRQGSPMKFHGPKEPGTYEVRYVLGRGKRLLAKTTITIAAP
jgi:microcystin-dependent protein